MITHTHIHTLLNTQGTLLTEIIVFLFYGMKPFQERLIVCSCSIATDMPQQDSSKSIRPLISATINILRMTCTAKMKKEHIFVKRLLLDIYEVL